jgi:hypothetical protein
MPRLGSTLLVAAVTVTAAMFPATRGAGQTVVACRHFVPSDCAAVLRVSGTSYRVVEPFKCCQSFSPS